MTTDVLMRVALAIGVFVLTISSIISNPRFELASTYRQGGLWLTAISCSVSFIAMWLLARRASSNEREVARLKEQSNCDSLTGVLSHRRVMEILEKECERSKTAISPTSVLMMDLDHFKLINDCFGHPAGNVVLGEVGRRIRAVCQGYGSVGRFGGDEFLFVVPDAAPGVAMVIATRIQTTIASMEFNFGEAPISLSLSIGVATSSTFREDSLELVTLADAALYRAKASRSGTIMHADEIESNKLIGNNVNPLSPR